jgi:hypothetical protein
MMRCPTCGSPDPSWHPATQYGGEISYLCRDPWHSPIKPELRSVFGLDAVATDGEVPAR